MELGNKGKSKRFSVYMQFCASLFKTRQKWGYVKHLTGASNSLTDLLIAFLCPLFQTEANIEQASSSGLGPEIMSKADHP